MPNVRTSLSILLVCGCAWLGGCQLIQYGKPPSETEEQRLARMVTELQAQIESFRGVRFQNRPHIQRIPLAQRCKELDTAARSGWVAGNGMDLAPSNDELWQATGLLRPTETSAAHREHLDCIAARSLYQVNAKRILVLLDSARPEEGHTLAHEMVHALQDERLDLRQLFRSTAEPDELIGILGAVEGEAEFVATRSLEGEGAGGCAPLVGSPLFQLDKAIRTFPDLAKVPASVSLPAYVPYAFGERLACRLFERLGLAGLDTLLHRPPRGSWQLWNFEAYLNNTQPLDWDTSWSALGPLPPGWKPSGQARAGEARLAGLPLAWDRQLAFTALSGRGLGWSGDRLWMASHPTRGHALFWRLAFDSPSKAKDFARLWWALRGLRLGVKLPPWKDKRGRISWSDPQGRNFQVRVVNREVGIGEGFDSVTTSRLVTRTMIRHQHIQ